jgi:hydrogenase maturation protease
MAVIPGNDPRHARRVLVFACGNPSRGDDALGPAMHALLQQAPIDDVDLQIDFQLQIEHVLDLENRVFILFIDATASGEEPFTLQRLVAERDASYTTHAMNPCALLDVYRQVNDHEPPEAYLLGIRGYEFGLGKALSDRACSNLHAAHDYLRKHPPWQACVA